MFKSGGAQNWKCWTLVWLCLWRKTGWRATNMMSADKADNEPRRSSRPGCHRRDNFYALTNLCLSNCQYWSSDELMLKMPGKTYGRSSFPLLPSSPFPLRSQTLASSHRGLPRPQGRISSTMPFFFSPRDGCSHALNFKIWDLVFCEIVGESGLDGTRLGSPLNLSSAESDVHGVKRSDLSGLGACRRRTILLYILFEQCNVIRLSGQGNAPRRTLTRRMWCAGLRRKR